MIDWKEFSDTLMFLGLWMIVGGFIGFGIACLKNGDGLRDLVKGGLSMFLALVFVSLIMAYSPR